jgi:WD40 repeat protein
MLAPGRLLMSDSGGVMLLDAAATAEPLARIETPDGLAAAPAVSADGRFVAIAGNAGDGARVSLIAVADGSRLGQFETDSWSDWTLAPDAAYLAFVDGSRRGRLLDARSGELLAEFFHDSALTRVFASAAAERIVAVDDRGAILAWQMRGEGEALGPRDSQVLGLTAAPESLALAASGSTLAYLDSDGLVTALDPATGYRQASLWQGETTGLHMRLSPDGDRLVTVSDSLLRFWDLGSNRSSGPDFGAVSAVAIDRGGKLGVLGQGGGQVGLLHGLPAAVARGAASEAVTGHRGSVTRLALGASGELAASGGSDGVVRVWNTTTGMRSPYLLRHPTGPIEALAISPDGRWLASAGENSVRVFVLASGELLREIELEGRPFAIAISADSLIVAIGDSAGNIYLASPDMQQGVQTLRGRTPISALAFGQTRELLASGSADGDLVLWDTLAGTAIAGAYRFKGSIRWIEFSGDASTVWLQSGVWLHRLDRGVDPPAIAVSRLIPEELRPAPALALIDDALIRGLANRGGGRLALVDIALGPTASAADWPDRDWTRVLGFRLDSATGEPVRRYP